MKIGVSAYSFSAYMRATGASYIDVCDKAKELGFSGIEFTELNSKNPMETAREIKAHCKKIGLDIIAYSVGATFNRIFKGKTIAKLKACVDVAKELGVPLMRHDVCYKLYPWQNYKSVIQSIAPGIREVSRYAKEKGIMTCTENHGFIMQRSERMVELLKAVDFDNYHLLCDMGNFLCADEEPKHAVPIVAPYAIHVHAKDFLRRNASEGSADGYFKTVGGNYLLGTVLGKGVVPIDFCLKTLRDAGYKGYIAFEFEGKDDCIEALKQGLCYVKSLNII